MKTFGSLLLVFGLIGGLGGCWMSAFDESKHAPDAIYAVISWLCALTGAVFYSAASIIESLHHPTRRKQEPPE